jgi:mRNA-degrading endonuclease toxin of MazEF toxin-antitoxin module
MCPTWATWPGSNSTRIKGYPFEVRTRFEGQDGVVLSDQVKSLD